MVFRCIVLLLLAFACAHGGVLEDYVNRYDPHYTYEVLKDHTYRGPDYTLYVLNMTSQKWKDETVVTNPIWWHYLTITVPDKLVFKDSAFILIDGGSNHAGPPSVKDNFVSLTTMMAVSTGCIGADLKMIPNQPTTFLADPTHKARSEDAVIAWTWKTFVQVNSSDPELLLRFPMTKATVRGMDTIANFSQSLQEINIDKFYVAGASKRGWTTWTTAAVDPRVKGISPIVMDLLHMVKNLHHHFRAYGGWTFAFKDYYELNFTESLDHPNTQKMADIIDPISYNDKLTMPKLIISTGGDEFFLPDDSHYYYNDLNGPKYLRILPNAEHSCAGHEISLLFTMRAFFLSIMSASPLPKFSWVRELTANGGKITVTTETEPLTVTSYWAKTIGGERRDFRLLVGTPGNPEKPFPHPVIWHSQATEYVGNNTYVAEFENPDEGWRAFFIQLTFRGVKDSVLEFTTESQIIPDVFPFPDCSGESCTGTLV
ncbi:autocrine proliferation repressor protein A-like [Haliotis cracherodii]|uniref:autocrine proliferation repressor protein A-like n=1 Tax=Haliotis cracherodii TaxID=6455 RepID=UPI0039E7C0C2